MSSSLNSLSRKARYDCPALWFSLQLMQLLPRQPIYPDIPRGLNELCKKKKDRRSSLLPSSWNASFLYIHPDSHIDVNLERHYSGLFFFIFLLITLIKWALSNSLQKYYRIFWPRKLCKIDKEISTQVSEGYCSYLCLISDQGSNLWLSPLGKDKESEELLHVIAWLVCQRESKRVSCGIAGRITLVWAICIDKGHFPPDYSHWRLTLFLVANPLRFFLVTSNFAKLLLFENTYEKIYLRMIFGWIRIKTSFGIRFFRYICFSSQSVNIFL